jgi:uncharacterized protein with von Willebrand factor type A (vWA) domain
VTQSAEDLLARRIAAFTATLRGAGFTAGLAESADAARILASPLARRPATLRAALRALFAASRSEWQRFDAIFDAAFLGRRLRHAIRSAGPVPARGPRTLRELAADRAGQPLPGSAEATAPGPDAEPGTGPSLHDIAAATERRAGEDLRAIADPAALAEAEAAAARLWAALRTQRARRQRHQHRGRRLDLRQTIRASLGHGGTPIALVWRRPRRKRLRVALLLDVSGSMTLHTPLFLRFALGLLRGPVPAEAFMFHTRLVEITGALRERDRLRALDRLTLLARGVGGGTRIGESLAAFNRWHARRALAGRSVCFIVSDGYETGDAAQLGREMAVLHRRCRRILWLNPAADEPGYAPSARGMQAALPYLRLFAPAGTLAGLDAIGPRLGRL